jgi:hypothetical protein
VEGEGFQISLNSRAATTIGTGDGESNGSHRRLAIKRTMTLQKFGDI